MPKGKSKSKVPGPRNGLTNQPTARAAVLRQGRDFGAQRNRIRGTEKVCTVKNLGELQRVFIDFIGLSSTRVAQVLKMYERYFVHSITFKYVPTVAKTAAGMVTMSPDYDSGDGNVWTASDLVEKLSQMKGSVSCSVSNSSIVDMANPEVIKGEYLRPVLFVDPVSDRRLSSYGQLLIFLSGSDSAANSTVGYVEMSYDITALVPCPAPQVSIELPNITKLSSTGAVVNAITSGETVDIAKCLVTDSNMDLCAVYYATIDSYSGATTLKDASGAVVSPGARIVFTPAKSTISAGTSSVIDNVSSGYVGRIMTSIGGQILKFVAGGAADILLRDVKGILKSYV